MRRTTQWKLAIVAATLGWTTLAILWVEPIEPAFFTRNFLAALWHDTRTPHLTVAMETNVPGLKPFLVVLTTVTGIDLATVHQLPLGVAVRSLLYATIIYQVTQRVDLAAVTSLITLWYPWAAWGYNNVFVHALGGVLFLTLVVVAMNAVDGQRRTHTVVALVLIGGLFLLDYTAHVWTIGMVLSCVVVSHISQQLRSTGWVVATVVAGMLFTFKQTIVTYTGMFDTLNPIAPLTSYFTATENTKSIYSYTPDTTGLGLSGAVYLVIGLAFLAYVCALGSHLVRERSLQRTLRRISTHEGILGAMLVGGGVGTVLYTFMERFSQFFIFLTAPLVAICALWYTPRYVPRLHPYRVALCIACAVILASLVGAELGVMLATDGLDQESEAISETDSMGVHLATYTDNPTVQTDLTTAGRMRMAAVQNRNNFNWKWYNETRYAQTIGAAPDPPPADFVVIDRKSQAGERTIDGSWGRYEPLSNYESSITANRNLQRVHCTPEVCTYAVVDADNQ
ncbi:hypothetical protein [Natrinema altunense]|uniref:Uncharacterized protein n=1 Tax=Natrinema altunense TaxID=222984 RepID=A0A482Y2S2_9EURY|nr:hypothetical protein [Natrinema altunense]RZH69170.1 hypothetical protein ELS17_06910 [Natrinema altunense]